MKNVVFDFHGVIHDPGSGGINSEILQIIESLHKRGIPLNIFTNSPVEALKRRDQNKPFLKYFKEVVHQYSKPHSQSFEELFNRLGCEPSEIILIDDSPNVIEEAEKQGITTVEYEGVSELKEQLEEFLEISLDREA
jgi:HAD superfamily hydrolase (TIGR01509 family)